MLTTPDHYWQAYQATLPAPTPDEPYRLEQFGDTPALADELGRLIVAGIKTATCSALWEWQAEGSPLPCIGLKSIVLAGDGTPLCIIETTEVSVQPFAAVDAQFAYDEGEDDRSLACWRQGHWQFFARVLPRIGREPTLEMPLVCERFRVIYPVR